MNITEKLNAVLTANAEAIGSVSPETVGLLVRYLDELYRVNEYMNLTAIKSEDDACLKHIADALTLLPLIPSGVRLLDVGTGGGIPSVPLAIARPDLRVVGLDSTGKKVNFITETVAGLGLRNISAVCGRAEELSLRKPYRESFDFVTARALARFNVLCELCLPFVRVGGTFISMKGPLAPDEISESRQALKILGGEMTENRVLRLKPEDGADGEMLERTLIIVKKTRPTPTNYPRNNAQINKNPL